MARSGRLSPGGDQRESGRQQILDVIRAAESIARIDIAKALLKEPGDDNKLITFNVGTQF